jgi:hypothetical protein
MFKKNQNSENLLITLGDSWTQGVGCYPDEFLKQFYSGKITAIQLGELAYDVDYFSKRSWPAQLSQDIKYDLINLAKGGSANSFSAKTLLSEFDEDLSKYKNVVVVWILSEPSRFSFYSNNIIQSWLPAWPHQNRASTYKFLQSYFEEVAPSFNDDVKETEFYLKAVDYYCKAKGYKFAYGSAFTNFEGFEDISNNIHKYTTYKNFNVMLSNIDKCALYAPCGHPNEVGYQYMSTAIGQLLKTNLQFI